MEQQTEEDLQLFLSQFPPEKRASVLDLITSKKKTEVTKLKDSLYRCKFPTPEEFLTHEWLGGVADGLFPEVKRVFIDIWNYEKRYSEVVLYGSTRGGKSVISRLCIVYCIVLIWCLREPHKFYGANEMSSFAIFLMSFAKTKAEALLLKPIFNILKKSPKFYQVKFEDQVDDTQAKFGTEKIVWTTASRIGSCSFSNDIHICLGATPTDIIGADIVMALITEINFFIETIGVTESEVWQLFTDTKDRINGTIGKKYGAMIILDSSANNRESLIESYILEEAVKDPSVYYWAKTRWDARPELYPDYGRTGKTFKVFIGSNNRSPCIVTENFKMFKGDDKLIIDAPIDAYEAFKKNIFKSLKDQAGIASGYDSLLFPDWDVFELLWDYRIPTVTTPLEAPITKKAEGLIMEQVKEILFKKEIGDKLVLRRAPGAPRWVSIDLSESERSTGFAMCHAEMRDNGEVICVYDLVFDIIPTKGGINLEAVLSFIRELYQKYHIFIAGVSSDRYQSSYIKQGITKDEKEYSLISVDTDKAPYLVFRSKLLNGNLKTGYYSHLANNLKSLIEKKDKIEHTVGKSKRGTEEDISIGRHAKDLSDAASASCHYLYREISKHPVRYNYDDINRVLDLRGSYQVDDVFSKKEEEGLLLSLQQNIMKNKIRPKRVGV